MSYQVGNDEEVTRKSHIGHDIEFVINACAIFLGSAIAHLFKEPSYRFLAKPRIFSFTLWHWEGREQILIFAELDVTTLCNQKSVIATFRELLKELAHLRWSLEIELIVIELKSLWVGKSCS